MKKVKQAGWAMMLVWSLLSLSTYSQVKIDENTFGEIKARNIGTASTSGRIACLDAVRSDPRILYVGSAGGGVWKTVNAGTIFKPVFDKENQCIGALTIDQQHPDTVWVGTGEPWTRNSVSVGDGVYVTYNGGKDWVNKGLQTTERIARIVIDPVNPQIVYVAALGPLWNASPERGLYKTTDGGQTWEKILYVDENTGCSGIAVDPDNPEIVYAGMWDFRRSPWFFRSGGNGSGFFMSKDGGKTWEKQENGLPAKPWGRVYVDISPADNNMVYVLIEAEKTGLYRSADKGQSWNLMSTAQAVGDRPFYFGYFVPDPADTAIIYKPGFNLNVSEDGGKTFMSASVSGTSFHGDVHALWIDPSNSNFMYMGTDGGVYLSYDQGKKWDFCWNLPVSQFYHVSVDNEEPYNVYGGLQDNGSWTGPSEAPGGITPADWKNLGWGDGFNVLRDPKDNNIIYWQWQGGNLRRMYIDTRELKDIMPYTEDGTKLRFHWNTPLIFGAKSNKLYTASQFLYQSADMGNTWLVLSPDLTTNDTAKLKQEQTGGLTVDNSSAENHCTIYTIAESPINENVIWVGTDDGNIQLTTDQGKSWTNLVNNISGLPLHTGCSYVCASSFDEGTAFVTFDGHALGDMTSYVFRTSDYGKTWTSLSTPDVKGYCHVIRQDPKNPQLLYLGTEFGLFISLDEGGQWTRFTGNLPKVAVRDLAFQQRENDLVIATHGRGIYIVDDLTPLQNLTDQKLNADLAYLGSKPYELGSGAGMQTFFGDAYYVADNPSTVVNINYFMKKRHVFGEMKIEVYDSSGKLLKTLPAGKRAGINKVEWKMEMEKPKVPSSVQLLGQAMSGPSYPPGEYTVKIIKNQDTIAGTITVVYDENPHHTIADRDERYALLMKAYNILEDLAYLDNQIIEIRDRAASAADSTSGALQNSLKALVVQMNELRTKILATKEGQITGEVRLREQIGDIYGGILSYQGKPTQSQINGLNELAGQMDEMNSAVGDVITITLPPIDKKLEKAGLKPFVLTDKTSFMEKED